MTNLKVHIHTSAPDKFYVNSFVIEGDKSLILVDTQFVLSEVVLVIDKLKAFTKPLAAVFITHPHPDHYNGLQTLLESFPGTPVYATESTLEGIKATAEAKRAFWTPLIGEDYPQAFSFPDRTLKSGEGLNIDGIDLTVHDLGPAECSDNTAIALPQIDSVIVSDLVYNRVHPWLAESRSGAWMRALHNAKSLFGTASTLYAGHGTSGQAHILDDQISYIEDMRSVVEHELGNASELPDAAKDRIRNHILGRYPGFELSTLIDANADGIVAELRSDR